jgi:hypothetical protein
LWLAVEKESSSEIEIEEFCVKLIDSLAASIGKSSELKNESEKLLKNLPISSFSFGLGSSFLFDRFDRAGLDCCPGS